MNERVNFNPEIINPDAFGGEAKPLIEALTKNEASRYGVESLAPAARIPRGEAGIPARNQEMELFIKAAGTRDNLKQLITETRNADGTSDLLALIGCLVFPKDEKLAAELMECLYKEGNIILEGDLGKRQELHQEIMEQLAVVDFEGQGAGEGTLLNRCLRIMILEKQKGGSVQTEELERAWKESQGAELPSPVGEIRIEKMESSWASEAVVVTTDANGGVRINPNRPEFPSKWKKGYRQYERRGGEIAMIEAGDKKVEISMVDEGAEMERFPGEVENQMSYWFELRFGYQVRAETVKSWFSQVQLLSLLQQNYPRWGEPKVESGARADSFNLRLGNIRYHICVPVNSATVKVVWFSTSKSDYDKSKFPPDLLFEGLCAVTEIYTNSWLGKKVPNPSVAEEEKPVVTSPAPTEAVEPKQETEIPDWLAKLQAEAGLVETQEEKPQKPAEKSTMPPIRKKL